MSSSIVSGSGANLLTWPSSGAIPASYSAGGWTYGNEGFAQQTFLGASVRNFSMKGGFGAGSSSLSMNLIEDEYNKSDGLGLGLGDDVYHDGTRDKFVPPVVGCPVFFKFGRTMASVKEAYVSTFDSIYGYNSYGTGDVVTKTTHGKDGPGNINQRPSEFHYYSGVDTTQEFNGSGDNVWANEYPLIAGPHRGRNHLVFGGILQSTTENRSEGGNPSYSVNITDPREILSNVMVVLKDYAGSNFGQSNILNVFGFLEFDPSETLKTRLETGATKSVLTKTVGPNGDISFAGLDVYTRSASVTPDRIAPEFPITGEGMSRTSSKGVPFYRIRQSINTLLEYNGVLPDEYKDAFGTQINFRGFKYVVDFGGLPVEMIPHMYNMNFAQTDLLSIAQEICDVVSMDLFVTLLPVIDHPASKWLYDYNQDKIHTGNTEDIVAGIIRVDSIDRSAEPKYGAVQSYLDGLTAQGIEITNQDLGYELSNNPVDKFVIGAQETRMYYFDTDEDRDHKEIIKKGLGLTNAAAEKLASQWSLETSLSQSVLPFYGFLGKDAVTIPRGWGSYQQILLDTSSLAAHGVDNYYVATELELRAALISFDRWKEFLLLYSEVYMESLEEDDLIQAAILNTTSVTSNTADQAYKDRVAAMGALVKDGISHNYAVTVPRCVFKSDKDYVDPDGLPASPCSPPFGYPLYYKRAQRIGIPEAGVARITSKITKIFTDYGSLKQRLDSAHNNFDIAMSDWSDIFEDMTSAGAPYEVLGQSALANEMLLSWYATFSTEIDTLADFVCETFNLAPVAGGLSDPDITAANNLVEARNTVERIQNQIGLIDEVIQRNCDIIKTVSRLGKKTIENAMAVYSFVKGVAEKHLGKTFLVKIPKACNLNYSVDVVVDELGFLQSSPMGFKAEPINKDPGHFFTRAFQASLIQYQERGEQYKYGSLKSNYDPISDVWKHNYKPKKGGGYFDYYLNPQTVLPHQLFGTQPEEGLGFVANTAAGAAQITNQAYLTPAVKSYLFPLDSTSLVSKNGKVHPYVRFDNSQHISFHGISKKDVTQQIITNTGIIRPLLGQLDNMDEDKFHSFDPSERLKALPNTVAFVKCSVDERLYMPPKLETTDTAVFGRYVQDIGQMTAPRKIYNKDTCLFEYTQKYYQPHWVPHITTGGAGPTGGEKNLPTGPNCQGGIKVVPWTDFYRIPLYASSDKSPKNGNMVQTNAFDLDSDHVYAIITLPGRVTPTIDSRMQDSRAQAFHAATLKHYLTMDTVKIPQFSFPEWKNQPTSTIADICPVSTIGVIQNAFRAYKVAMEKLSIACPEANIHFTAPSPVYPNLVALPLESTERCYGPWVSSFVKDSSMPFMSSNPRSVRYANLGGKVEFEKDENLAPWNFGGFQLMNEAGSLKAAFSNSIMLFSERGGFVYSDVPRGNDLGKILTNGGPLVTDINVDVGSEGIKTTYKMDLYTPRFGKLKKQHEQLIGNIAREKQKLLDQTNLLIRNGIIQDDSDVDYSAEFKKFEELTNLAEASYTPLQRSSTYSDLLIGQVQYEDVTEVTLDGEERHYTKAAVDVSAMPNKIYKEALAMFPDSESRDKAYYDSAGGSLSEIFAPASESKHPNMAYEKETFREQKKELFYKTDNTGF